MKQELGITRKQNFDFNTPKKKPKIAYFILIHHFPEQFKRLFKAIYHLENHYLIHIDKKTDINIKKDIKVFLENYSNVYALKSENVIWDGYSMVQSQLNGMKYLLNRCLKWDFFINLSDQDFPLKSQDFILGFLNKNKGKNFIKIGNQVRVGSDTLNHVENYSQGIDIGFSGIPYRKSFMKNVTWYVGGQWAILTRTCCEFIYHSPEVKKIENFYHKLLIAEESFFQTVLMNTSFKETIINDNKRVVIYIADGDTKFKPKTLTDSDIDLLIEGDNLFVGKFDERIDESILNILEKALDTDQIKNNSNLINFNLISTFNIDTKKSALLDPEAIINSPTQLPKQILNGNK
ncbi:beta-1,6-N-acetylglucosaminyltransferase [uncultured Aquimarina sp.]|uniref:beta-1,6-N-acetylglucosaminyltransferase n=1 Tax=uncultured Aquimarina sp. TaxID=575652 RepID=UPI00261EAB93|nr:beta-1,6-N-acetylglucosaminyltransferase [uncultured Aquimarina sp.]